MKLRSCKSLMGHTESLTRDEIKDYRSKILQSSQHTTRIYVGDKRIKSSTRICGVCHRRLTTFVAETCETSVIGNHLSCKTSSFATINICADIRSCYANIGQKEGQ